MISNDQAKALTLDKQVAVTDPTTNSPVTGSIKDLYEDENGNVKITIEHQTITRTQFDPADITLADSVTPV